MSDYWKGFVAGVVTMTIVALAGLLILDWIW
jgi:hypothetical protein